jgi:hypothetical protein
VSERRRIPEPPPEVVRLAERVLVEVLAAKYPQYEVVVHDPDRPLPPGAVHLPAVDEADRKAIRDRRARDRRRDDDAGDQ